MEKLKKRWGISSNWQIAVIFVVFGLTGSSSVYIARPILESFGFSRELFPETSWWGGPLYYAIRLLVIFPLYQILLISIGWIFGQFKFFFNFEKDMLRKMGFLRVRK